MSTLKQMVPILGVGPLLQAIRARALVSHYHHSTPRKELKCGKLVLRRSEREVAQAIEQTGVLDIAAQLAAEGLVDSFYKVSFESRDSFSFAEPYITSFCTHADWPYERENGLLSQWRGYGGAGGYCAAGATAFIKVPWS